MDQLAEDDHAEEDEADDEHPADDIGSLRGGVEEHHAATLAEWRARASAGAAARAPGRPPSGRAAPPRAPPAPAPAPAGRAAQPEMRSAIGATAGTPPAWAIRTSPCA